MPVSISLGAGAGTSKLYDRSFDLTARQFSAFSAHAGDMREPLTTVGEDLHTQIAAAFASQGATGASGKWRQLSPAYAEWKQKHVAGVPTLVGIRPTRKRDRHSPRKPAQTYRVSGRMMKQLLVPVGKASGGSTWHITRTRLLYAPLSDIAGFHETGTPNMPARPPVDPTLTFLHSVDRTFVRWIAGLVDAMGLAA